MELARRDDPALQAMEAVFAALKEVIGFEKAMSVAQIIQSADKTASGVNGLQLVHPSLKEALGTVAGQRGIIDSANKIGRITTTGVLTEFPVPTSNSAPTGIALGSDGNLWFTEVGANKIGRITTAGVLPNSPFRRAAAVLGW
jgi:hypothetical protein